MAVGGTIATIATAGVATPIAGPVVIAGVAVSITGGGASFGASMADIIVPKLKLSEVQKQIDADNKKVAGSNPAKKRVEEIAGVFQKRSLSVNHSHNSKGVVNITVGAASSIGRAVKLGEIAATAGKSVAQFGKVSSGIAKGGAAAARLGGAALQGATLRGIALEVVIIPLNITEIVMSGISLYKGSETKASRQLRETADEYKKQLDIVLKITKHPQATSK